MLILITRQLDIILEFLFCFVLQVLVIWSFCFVCDCSQGYSECMRTRGQAELHPFDPEPERTCNTPKYTLAVLDMFRVFCQCNLNVS